MLTLQNTDAIRRIEAAIGYTFRDKRLLVQVFTRKTYMKVDPEAPDNEVLEFYGDMLMSYHVTTYFVDKFAHMLDDGLYFMRSVEQFTEMRSHYVRNQYLTDRIKQLIPNIDRLLRAQNPRVELPKDNQKAYADLFESMIGAVYLDSYRDDDLIRAFILRHLNIEPKAVDGIAPKSARTVVLPAVSLLDREPLPAEEEEETEDLLPLDHAPAAGKSPAEEAPAPLAEIPVQEAPVEETAKPDCEAVEEPAESADMPVPVPPAEEASAAPSTPNRDALTEYCLVCGYEAPLFSEPPKNAPNARPVAACTVRFRNKRGKPVKISLNDSGRTIAEASEKVALKMLKKLREQQAAEDTAPGGGSVTEATAPVEIPAAPETATPTEPAPAEVTSAEATPAEQTPAPSASAAEAAPAEQTTAEAAPAEQTTVEEAPIETAEESAAEEPTAAGSPVADTPAETAPAAEVPATKKSAPRRKKQPAKAVAPAADVPAPHGVPETSDAPAAEVGTQATDAPVETVPTPPVETAPAETAPVAPQKRSTRKPAARKQTAPVTDRSAPASEPVSTETAPADKPAPRRPRAKKAAEAAPADGDLPVEKPRRRPAARQKKPDAE